MADAVASMLAKIMGSLFIIKFSIANAITKSYIAKYVTKKYITKSYLGSNLCGASAVPKYLMALN